MSMNMSILIPTYNRNLYLIKTLRSFLNQNYSNFEIIVIDQSDKKFSQKEKFIKENANKIVYLRQEEPSIPKAINLGIKLAKGDIVIFTDDDVLASSRFLSFHLEEYKDPQVVGVQGRVITRGQIEEPDFIGVGRITPWGSVAGGFSSQIPQEVKNVIGCNVSFRKEWIEKVGGVDENFIGNSLRWETDLALRIVGSGGKIVFSPRAELIHLRAKTGGCRMSDRKKWFYDFFHNETYFFLKHINWFWWPIFWLTRWKWFIRCMFGKGRSLKTLIIPFLGIWGGLLTYKRRKNENRN